MLSVRNSAPPFRSSDRRRNPLHWAIVFPSRSETDVEKHLHGGIEMTDRSRHAREKVRAADGRDAQSENVAWHALTAAESAEKLQSDLARGLTEAEAARRLARAGPNRLEGLHGRSAWAIFFAQFRSLIVLLLVAATLIAFGLGENVEAVAILVVIVLNAAIGFLTEWKAEQALAALRKQSVPVAHVVRDGVERQVPAAELVAGDLVILSAGVRLPADRAHHRRRPVAG